MSFRKKLATDPDLETGTGITLDFGKEGTMQIHRAGGRNDKYLRVFAAKWKPFERKRKLGEVDIDTSNRLMAEIYADSVIIGWNGVRDDDEKPIPFNRKNVIDLLVDVPDLFLDIIGQAEDAALFRSERVEEAAGNSSTGSASTSSKGTRRKS